LIVKAVAASPSGMSQSQIASTRSATAAEGRMLLENPSAKICSLPDFGDCSSRCESPIGRPHTTRKAPPCGKNRRKPVKPSATFDVKAAFKGCSWLFLVAIVTVETFRHQAGGASFEKQSSPCVRTYNERHTGVERKGGMGRWRDLRYRAGDRTHTGRRGMWSSPVARNHCPRSM
jgi:hypothetical protein